MNGSPIWLDTWKTRAQNRRQMLAQRLSQRPVNPEVTSIRDLYLKQAQNALNTRKSWAEAYLDHVKGMQSVISNASTASSSAGAKSGSLGNS
jgi:hypothetical protein